MFVYIHAVNYPILTELDEDINILICSASLIRIPEHEDKISIKFHENILNGF